MPIEFYYAPKDENALLPTLDEVQRRFEAADLPCTIESDQDDSRFHWLVFEPQSTTTIHAQTKGKPVVFATVEAPFDDSPEFLEKIDGVLESLGFACGDPNECT